MKDVLIEKIYSEPESHCAFTSLIKYAGKLFCAFRVAPRHMPCKSKIVVLVCDLDDPNKIPGQSRYGRTHWHKVWESDTQNDLRDPQFLVYRDKLYLFYVKANFKCDRGWLLPEHKWRWQLKNLDVYRLRIKSAGDLSWGFSEKKVCFNDRRIRFKTDPDPFGRNVPAGSTSLFPWHFYVQDEKVFALAYDPLYFREMAIYQSNANLSAFSITPFFLPASVSTSEGCVLPREDGSLYYVARSESNEFSTVGLISEEGSLLYRDPAVVHCPRLVDTSSGVFCVGRQFYPGTFSSGLSIWKLNPVTIKLEHFLFLPSKGDNGYPGVVYDNGKLLISYYSQHCIENIGNGDNTCPSEIFFAEVSIES